MSECIKTLLENSAKACGVDFYEGSLVEENGDAYASILGKVPVPGKEHEYPELWIESHWFPHQNIDQMFFVVSRLGLILNFTEGFVYDYYNPSNKSFFEPTMIQHVMWSVMAVAANIGKSEKGSK